MGICHPMCSSLRHAEERSDVGICRPICSSLRHAEERSDVGISGKAMSRRLRAMRLPRLIPNLAMTRWIVTGIFFNTRDM